MEKSKCKYIGDCENKCLTHCLEKTLAKSKELTPMQELIDFQCCGIFPTNDCKPCSYYKSQINKMKNSEILKEINVNDVLEIQISRLYTKISGYEMYETETYIAEEFKDKKLLGRKTDDVFTKILISKSDLNSERFRIIKINKKQVNVPYIH